MSARDLTLRSVRGGERLGAAWRIFANLRPIEQIACAATVVTPAALLLDYRSGVSVWSVPHTYPLVYLGSYRDPGNLGLTPLLWIAAGLAALVRPSTRRGFRTVSTLSLVLLTLVVLAATIGFHGPDRFTAYALLFSLLPLIAMTGIFTNDGLRPEVLTRIIAFIVVVAAGGVLLTLAHDAYGTLRHFPSGDGRTLSDRFDVFLFGPNGPPATGAALAGLAMLVPAAGIRRRYQVAVALCLIVGLFASQTRGAVVALVVGTVVFALIAATGRRTLIGLAVASVLIFSVASRRGITAVSDPSNIIRRTQVVKHVDAFRERPLTGFGLSVPSANDVSGAHNALLSVAVAGGIAAVVLWLLAWCYPVAVALGGRRRSVFLGSAAATIVAFCVGWATTGNEIFIVTPPTNFLPLVIAAALAMRAARPEPVPDGRRAGELVLPLAFVLGIALVAVGPAAAVRALGIPNRLGPRTHLVSFSSGNAVANTGAESGIGGWSTAVAGSGLAPRLVQARSPAGGFVTAGRYAFLVYATNVSSGPRDEGAYTAGAVRLRPGKTYRLSAVVSGVATPAQPLLLGLRLADGSLSQAMFEGEARGARKIVTGNRSRLEGRITPSRDVGPVQVAIWKKALPAGATAVFAFDDVRLCAIGSPGC